MAGLPSSCLFFPRALSPFTPEGLTGASNRFFPASGGFTIFERLAALNLCNEADSSSPYATARAFASPGSGPEVTLSHRWVSYMYNDQFTWQTPFILREQPSFLGAPKDTKNGIR